MEEDRAPGPFSVLPWILPMACLLSWFLVCREGLVPPYLLPHPWDVGVAGYRYLFGMLESSPFAGRFTKDALASVGRVTAGYSLAVLLGLPLGILSGRVPAVQSLLGLTINGLRAVPGISWLPLALIWFGIGMKTTLFLVAMAAFFPIYLNAAAGARQVSPVLLRAGAMMGLTPLQAILFILIPGSMPHILTGLRLGLGISWAYLVLGELSGVPNGLGAVIMDARLAGNIEMILVGIILIAALGRLSDALLKILVKALFKSARRMA